MKGHWTEGNQISLLENGEEFFPRVFAAIKNAQSEVVLETFIWFDDKVGKQLHAVLISAARRGVQVDVTIDGFGSPDLSLEFLSALHDAGVRVHVFDPKPRLRWLGWRTNMLRRMHRKIVVVDGQVAFVGGINYSVDHLMDNGREAKQDYAIEIHGPLVADIHRFVHAVLITGQATRQARHAYFNRSQRHARKNTQFEAVGQAQALFVTRDNRRHQDDIERHYRMAIRTAQKRIVIANAYFFPGYRFIKALHRAAKRGVDVRLILQGEPDMPIVKTAARMLYHHLLHAGVHIYEYGDRALHGKVALMDDQWATVGSSNLDPLSLSLNLEANVIIRDAAFNQDLSKHMDQLMQHSCRQIQANELGDFTWWRLVRSFFIFHLLRYYPALEPLAAAARAQADAGMDLLSQPFY